jgi:uncharacterized protein YhaN
MKILSLQLIAYGPFTDTTLDFTGGGTGLHVIYGPNEAGKSMALRALRQMLFGIPVRTTASFLHPNPNLRIGGRLVNSNGASIEFVRRKGRVKTLRDADDQTILADEALVPFLGGLSREVFEQMFAIGHEEMVKGGEEIVSGAGSVGESLFTAGAGLIELQGTRKDLDSECSALFKPGGKNPVINKTLAALRETGRAQKEVLLLARTWKGHDQALQAARNQLESNHQKLSKLKQDSGKLERIRKALPLIARFKEVAAELTDYQGVPRLPEDFGEKRRKAANDLEIAGNDLTRAESTRQKLKDRLATIAVPENLIRNSALIESLQHDLGSYRKAQNDRPGLEARKGILSRQVAEKLSETELGDLAGENQALKLPPSTVGEIQALNKTFERLTARKEADTERLRKIEIQINSLAERKEKLAAPADVTALKAAIRTVEGAGPVEDQCSELRLAIGTREVSLASALKRLPLWTGGAETLDTVQCLSTESVHHFEERFAVSQRRIEKFADENQAVTHEAAQVQSDLDAIRFAQEVPTESDLDRARSDRGDGWSLVRSKLEGSEPPTEDLNAFTALFDGDLILPDAFEKSVVQADYIADRLRREAGQVSRKGVLESKKHQLEKSLKTLAGDLAAARTEQAGLEAEWRQRWEVTGVEPLLPREMRQWLADVQSIREKMADIRTQKLKTDTMAAKIESLQTLLIKALAEHGKTATAGDQLSKLADIGTACVASQEKLQSRTEKIDAELISRRKEKEDVEAGLADLEEKLSQWEGRWTKSMTAIGVASKVRPAAAMMIIENIREAKALTDEADVLGKRIEGIDRDADTFKQQVGHLVDTLAPELGEEPPERAAMQLNTRLTEARELQSTIKNIEAQLTAVNTDRQDAEKRVADAGTLLDSLCRDARCQGPDELEAVEKRSRARQELNREREAIETRLRELSAGATVDGFIAEAGLVEADSIDPELERIAGEVEGLEQERSVLDQTIGSEKGELARMDGSAKAAEYAEEKQRLLATLESDVEHYARFKIASVILARTIEQYREKHQGPLIKRASELFSQMTAGAFEGVRAEYDEDNPVLVGIRTGANKTVSVAGMSDGTADQLYLALRLASLEQYLGNNEPLPFIVDDILLRFDDDRSAATLKVLADLSQKTQVIFFTHHQHLVDLAKNSVDPEVLKQHVLGRA